MAAARVMYLLFLVSLQNRECKQVILAPTAPTSPRTLSKQLYYGISRSDVPSVTFPCVQQHQLVMMPAPTGPAGPTSPHALLPKQLDYGSSKSDVSSVPCQLTKS